MHSTQVPPHIPLAPQWYKLEDKKWDSKIKGELMLAVSMDIQADEALPEAWNLDVAATLSRQSVMQNISRVQLHITIFIYSFDHLRF